MFYKKYFYLNVKIYMYDVLQEVLLSKCQDLHVSCITRSTFMLAICREHLPCEVYTSE